MIRKPRHADAPKPASPAPDGVNQKVWNLAVAKAGDKMDKVLETAIDLVSRDGKTMERALADALETYQLT